MKKILNTNVLTAERVHTKMNMMKIVNSQELNKITKSKKSDAESNELRKPKLGWFDSLWWFIRNFLSSEANCILSVGVLGKPSWHLFLIQFLVQTNLFFFSFL